MRIARIARPGAIYDASAAAKTFAAWKIGDLQDDGEAIPNTKRGWEYAENKKRFRTHARLPGFFG